MTAPGSRLERALGVWLEARAAGEEPARLLARHDDLADLLEAMFDDEEPSTTAADEAEPDVFGDYRLVREIGRGGSGIVFEARQRSLDRRVALKLLAPAIASQSEALARFRREAMHLARFSHPGIVGILGVGETKGRHWLAMEFVAGTTLADCLRGLVAAGGHHSESVRRLVQVCADIAAALAHAHAQGIVHRDVKPGNILLRDDGGAVLGDFGLATRGGDTVTVLGVVAGTPAYMAPEQVRGEPLTAQSDVFGLGAVLYECLTLRSPFAGRSIDHTLGYILHRDPPEPRRVQRSLPADLSAVVMRALEKNPTRRYHDAAAFAEDLRAFLEFRPVQARRVTSLTRLARWARREPWRASVVASLALAVAVVGLYLWHVPEIRAAQRAQVEYEYESAMTRGFLAFSSRDGVAAQRLFALASSLAPERSEASAAELLATFQADGAAQALRVIEQRFPDLRAVPTDVLRVRLAALQRLERQAEAQALADRLGPPVSASEILIAAVARLGPAMRAEERAALAKDLSRAMLISPGPRLTLYTVWAQFVARDQRAEAVAVLTHLWPDHPEALRIGGALLATTDPARARDLLLRAIAAGADGVGERASLALAHVGLRAKESAKSAVQRALELQVPEEQAWLKIAHVLRELGEPEPLVAACRRWVREMPASSLAHGQLGQTLLDVADGEAEALAAFVRSAELAPADFEPQYNLAIALHATGREVEAAAQCRKVLALDPRNDRAHSRLLDILDDSDPAAVLGELERRCAACQDDAAAALRLARVHADGARFAEALMAAERAFTASRGTSVEALQLRAELHERLGEVNEAARCRARAAALPPE